MDAASMRYGRAAARRALTPYFFLFLGGVLMMAGMLPSDARRAHDLGGALGFGPLERAANEPPFHHEWEARVFVLNRLLLQAGIYNLDEFRYAIERMTPAAYAQASYYERWAIAIERLLTDKGVLP